MWRMCETPAWIRSLAWEWITYAGSAFGIDFVLKTLDYPTVFLVPLSYRFAEDKVGYSWVYIFTYIRVTSYGTSINWWHWTRARRFRGWWRWSWAAGDFRRCSPFLRVTHFLSAGLKDDRSTEIDKFHYFLRINFQREQIVNDKQKHTAKFRENDISILSTNTPLLASWASAQSR